MKSGKRVRRSALVFLLSVVMVVGLMPGFAFAEGEQAEGEQKGSELADVTKVTGDIVIKGIVTPKIGETYAQYKSRTNLSIENSSDTLTGSIEVSKENEGESTEMEDTDKFENEGEYTLSIFVNPSSSDYEFDIVEDDELSNPLYCVFEGEEYDVQNYEGFYYFAFAEELIVNKYFYLQKPAYCLDYDEECYTVKEGLQNRKPYVDYDLPSGDLTLKINAKDEEKVYAVRVQDCITYKYKYYKNTGDKSSFELTIPNNGHYINIEIIGYEIPVSGEYSICYDEDGGEVSVDKNKVTAYEIMNFTKKTDINIEFSQEPYYVEILDYDLGYLENLEYEGTTLTLNRKNNSPFSIYVYWTKEEMLYGSGGNERRISGPNRYDTAMDAAMAFSTVNKDQELDSIVVACGSNFPDALAGGYLAYLTNAPILLINNDDPDQWKDLYNYIEFNLSYEGKVYLLGGTVSVSGQFEDGIKEIMTDETPVRLGGADRYETNLKILEECIAQGGDFSDILICTGNNYPDSLSASAVKRPILLVSGDELTEAQSEFLADYPNANAYVIGGNSAVSQNMEASVNAICKGSESKRFAGENRYDTSRKIAEYFFPDGAKSVVLAVGTNFPDGLAGGPVAMKMESPIILTANDSQLDAKQYVAGTKSKKTKAEYCTILGGERLISDDTMYSIMGWDEYE